MDSDARLCLPSASNFRPLKSLYQCFGSHPPCPPLRRSLTAQRGHEPSFALRRNPCQTVAGSYGRPSGSSQTEPTIAQVDESSETRRARLTHPSKWLFKEHYALQVNFRRTSTTRHDVRGRRSRWAESKEIGPVALIITYPRLRPAAEDNRSGDISPSLTNSANRKQCRAKHLRSFGPLVKISSLRRYPKHLSGTLNYGPPSKGRSTRLMIA